MDDERRKDKRYKCLLPAHVVQAEGKQKLIQRTTVHDFSRGGCKLIVNIVTLDPGSDIELELYVPEKGLKTPLRAEIAWKKMAGDKLEIGLKIKSMKKGAKEEILKWISPVGLEAKKKQKKLTEKK
jgi:c-di-GMP-binding flagellar brake protein YcgR